MEDTPTNATLWTQTHRPAVGSYLRSSLDERLSNITNARMNLLFQGAPGVGKTAAARSLAAEMHAQPKRDLVEINLSDFFNRTKSDITDDERFAPFLRGKSRMAKRDMVNHVIKETAAYPPVDGSFKTLLLDNAESIREDFQQSLRRIMERHHQSTQFIIATRQPSSLIAPLRSRCHPIQFPTPTTSQVATRVEFICESETVEYTTDGIEQIATYADGNMRRGILLAQAAAEQHESLTETAVTSVRDESSHHDQLVSVLADIRSGDINNARKTVDSLLTEKSYSGDELVHRLIAASETVNTDQETAALARAAGPADMNIAEGTRADVHIMDMLTSWNQDCL